MADTSRVAPELVAALDYFPAIDFSQGIAPFRTGFDDRARPPVPPGLEVVQCTEHLIPGAPGDPDVRVLHYTPPRHADAPRPAVLHIHGGGYIMGDPEINDGMNRAIALEHGCVVVSVDYRLAPEVAWPGALHDCHAAFRWMHAEAATLGIDRSRIILTGESAGGGHAAALALHVRDLARRGEGRDNPKFRLVLLDSPMLDDRTGSGPDIHPHCGHFIWTPEANRFAWTAMLGHEAGSDTVPTKAVPARAEDVDDLPPHFISIGGLDLFLEESLEWTRRLARAGIAAELHVIPGAYHGFAMAQGSPQVAQLMQLRSAAFARAFAG